MAEGGAAERIITVLTAVFGKKNLPWAMVPTGFLIGIPLFYNVGFIVLVPFVFMVCASNKLPMLYVAIPLLAAASDKEARAVIQTTDMGFFVAGNMAIEQPLDLSIPENKMMLAIYLAAPKLKTTGER